MNEHTGHTFDGQGGGIRTWAADSPLEPSAVPLTGGLTLAEQRYASGRWDGAAALIQSPPAGATMSGVSTPATATPMDAVQSVGRRHQSEQVRYARSRPDHHPGEIRAAIRSASRWAASVGRFVATADLVDGWTLGEHRRGREEAAHVRRIRERRNLPAYRTSVLVMPRDRPELVVARTGDPTTTGPLHSHVEGTVTPRGGVKWHVTHLPLTRASITCPCHAYGSVWGQAGWHREHDDHAHVLGSDGIQCADRLPRGAGLDIECDGVNAHYWRYSMPGRALTWKSRRAFDEERVRASLRATQDLNQWLKHRTAHPVRYGPAPKCAPDPDHPRVPCGECSNCRRAMQRDRAAGRPPFGERPASDSSAASGAMAVASTSWDSAD